MNPDLLAQMTPEMMEGLSQVQRLLTAKRKNKPGPGGTGPMLPAVRRMGAGESNELGKVKELISALGGGMM